MGNERKQAPVYLISLPPEYAVTKDKVRSCQEISKTFDTLAKARQHAEDLARVNKGDTFHVYQINHPAYDHESCRITQVPWFIDPTLEEEE